MPRIRAFLHPIAGLFAAAWLLAVVQAFREPYVGATWDLDTVAAVEPGSPAAEAGLRPGDHLAGSGADFPHQDLRAGSAHTLRVRRGGRSLDLTLVPRRPPGAEITWRGTLALAGLAMILLGLWIYRRRPHTATALYLWLSLLLAFMLKPYSRLPLWLPGPLSEWLLLCAALAFPALVLHFVMVFPPGRKAVRPGPRTLAAVYGPPAVLLLLCTPLQLSVSAGRSLPPGWIVAVQAGVALYFLAALLLASLLFFQIYRGARTAVERSRLRVAFWGTVLGLLPVAAVSVLLIWIPLSRLPWVRYVGLSVLLVPLAFADAAVRHRVFDFEVVFKRSLVYSVLAAGSLAVYVLLAQVAGRWLAQVTHLPDLLWPALAIFLVGVLFGPVRARLWAAADQLFLRGRYDYRAELLRLTGELSDADSDEALLQRAFPELARVLGLSQLVFYRSNGNGSLQSARSLAALPEELVELPVSGAPRLAQAQQAMAWDLDAAHLFRLPARVSRALDSLPAAALLPLRCGGQLRGLWVLGRRNSSLWYEPSDLVLLSSLGARWGQSLERRELERQAQAQAHLKRELEMAHNVQRLLVPAHAPLYPTLDLATRSLACEEVGGDYYDFVPQGDHCFGFVVADSSGKGVPAALLMAGLQAQFRAEAPRHPEPSELLAALNARVIPDDDPCRYVALFYARVDVARRRICYANGGHPPPILVHADGATERLVEGGLLLGVHADARYDEEVRQLQRGDLLLFFTDGVIEERREDELFGEERLEALAVRHRQMRAQRLVQTLLEEVQAFTGQPLQDDVTLVAMKFL